MAYNESPHDQAGPGAMAVGVLESSPETKVALRLSDDGRLMVEVAGLAIDADIIDLDMDAITGAPPNNRSLYDIDETLQGSISGGASLFDVAGEVSSVAGSVDQVDSDVLGIIDALSSSGDLYGAIQILSGGTNLWALEYYLDGIKSTADLIDSDVIGVIMSLSVGSDLCNRVEMIESAVNDLGGGADLAMVDGDILRCADSLWAMTEGDTVTLQDVIDAVNGLKGVDSRTLTDVYNALIAA